MEELRCALGPGPSFPLPNVGAQGRAVNHFLSQLRLLGSLSLFFFSFSLPRRAGELIERDSDWEIISFLEAPPTGE